MNTGKLFLVGATHRTAPLGLREKLSLSVENEAALATELAAMPGVRELVILSTCNRVEIYVVGEISLRPAQFSAAFCARQNFDPADFAPLSLELSGRAVVQHLLEVASGLDSQMLGENEIFGQVKRAYLTAQTRGLAGPVLNRLFQKSFHAAKHVRTHTAITSGLVSVANVAADVAARVFGELSGASVLLLGAGEMGVKSGRAFRAHGATLSVASRRLERAQETANELGARAVSFDEVRDNLADFDVVLCSTSAPTTVISADAVQAAMRNRGGRPLFFIDLALPRDVDETVASMRNVYLYNLDDLAKIAAENRGAREAELERCREILTLKTDGLWSRVDALLGGDSDRVGAGDLYPIPVESMALLSATC